MLGTNWCTSRWLAILWRVRQSIPISSNILEGTALSTPSCSTACTNLLCSSGVQSTYTRFKKKLPFNIPEKLMSQNGNILKKDTQYSLSLSFFLSLSLSLCACAWLPWLLCTRMKFVTQKGERERERERERESLWDWFPSKKD